MGAFDRRTRNPTIEEIRALPARRHGANSESNNARLEVKGYVVLIFQLTLIYLYAGGILLSCDILIFYFIFKQVTKIEVKPQFDLAAVVGEALDRQVRVQYYNIV